MCWEEDEALHLADSPQEEYTCNTRKDKDKRVCRHSFGILVGCSPSGVGRISLSHPNLYILVIVTLFDELFQTENVKQVYGIVLDWMDSLDDKERRKIK